MNPTFSKIIASMFHKMWHCITRKGLHMGNAVLSLLGSQVNQWFNNLAFLSVTQEVASSSLVTRAIFKWHLLIFSSYILLIFYH